MKRRWIVLIVAVLLLAVVPAGAQDELSCAAEDVTGALDAIETALASAREAVDEGDLAGALAAIEEVEATAAEVQQQCRGWMWEGTNEDAVGPLSLEAGVYVLNFEVTASQSYGVFNAVFTNLDEEEFIGDFVNESLDEVGTYTGRQVIRLEGGRYLIGVDALGVEDWSLHLEKP